MFTESPAVYHSPPATQGDAATLPVRRTEFRLEAHNADSPQRAALEQFVLDGFKRKHGAQIRSFMPTLLALRNDAGDICAVLGYRSAFDHWLYLENYIDAPIELALAQKIGERIPRRAIVEIGNLAARRPDYALQLMRRLPAYLVERGHSWIVFTATRSVRRLLRDLGATPLEICHARAERITGAAQEWGRYYKTDPRVMAGHLPSGLKLKAFKPQVGY